MHQPYLGREILPTSLHEREAGGELTTELTLRK